MKPSFRYITAGLIAGGAILLAASPASAGNVNWAVSVGVPAPVVYSAPPPVYTAPVVYAPPPVYYAPAPAPAPMVYVSGVGYRPVHHRHHPHYYGHPYRHYY